MADKKKIPFKENVSPIWEKMVEIVINGDADVTFYPKNGEVQITVDSQKEWHLGYFLNICH